jgi:hypothetical protein
MQFRRYLVLFLLFVPALGKAQLGFTLREGRHRVQIPIEVVNNLVIIPVVLNGQLPLKFILDTGVRTTILTEKAFSDILNLTYSRRFLVAGPGGEKIVEAYVANNVSLDLPGVHGEGHAMLVLEKDYLELRNYLGTDVQGVLGYELFSRFVVEIDYEKKLMTLISLEYFKPKKKYQMIPISIQDTKPYVQVPVQLSDSVVINAKLLVDSGAGYGLVLDPSTNKLIKIPNKHVSSLIGRGLGGLITGQIGRIKSLNLGKYKIENVVANFPDPNSYIDTLKASDVFRNGTIGGEILSRFTVVYNFPSEKIYFKRNSAFDKKFYFNMSGLTLKAMGANLHKFEITDVRKDSSAEKVGIQNGDEVLSVNGLQADDMDLNLINSFFNSRPGRKIKLQVLRNGVRLMKTFTLESQI